MIFTAAAFALLQASAFALPANFKAPQNDIQIEARDIHGEDNGPIRLPATNLDSPNGGIAVTDFFPNDFPHTTYATDAPAATESKNNVNFACEAAEGVMPIYRLPNGTPSCGFKLAKSTRATATSTGTASATDSASPKVVLIAIPADEEKKVTELLKKNGLSMTGKYNSDDDTDGVQNKSFLSSLFSVGTSILSFVPMLL